MADNENEQDGLSEVVHVDHKRGVMLIRTKEGHGGYRYWSDEIPPGVCLFDEGLHSMEDMLRVMCHLYGPRAVGETFIKLVEES